MGVNKGWGRNESTDFGAELKAYFSVISAELKAYFEDTKMPAIWRKTGDLNGTK